MARYSITPVAMAAGLWANRALIGLLVVREIVGRYRGSVMGLLWSFFHPLLMLAVYTFVFSVVFKARWGERGESQVEFALILFAGLMIYSLFAECVGRAPSLVLGNVNFVKRVVFPLEVLPWVALGSALFHFAVSLLVWLAAYTAAFGPPPPSALWLPVVAIPLVFIILGLSWFLAAIGVYVRDVAQVVGVLVTTLLFLTPIFYPVEILPEQFRDLIALNPLTAIVGWGRDVLIWGKLPDWATFGLFTAMSFIVMWLGFAWFQKTRKGFADVI
ncbi:MAG: ABC transporter permease [Rhodospirillaceae bacterium]|nr:ABC transporter permease [Rhodospirillaceae bacterium]